MDEGWTRWLFDDFRLDYASLTNAEIQRGKLAERFDVIVFPDQSESSIVDGYHEGKMPPEFTGGIGANGIAALSEFANEGGTLVFLNHSTDFAIDQLKRSLPLFKSVGGVKAQDPELHVFQWNVLVSVSPGFARFSRNGGEVA